MNELEFVRRLGERARSGPRPTVDVADGVMRRIASVRRVEAARPFWPLAVGLSLATAASFLLAVQSYLALDTQFAEVGSWIGAML
jgi:hypothetical protein